MASGAVTLADYATISNDPLVTSVIYSLLENGNVLNDIPVVTRPTMVVNGSRVQGSLPDVNWSQLNEDPVTVRTATTPFSEQVYIVRNAVDVDKVLVSDQNQIMDPRAFNLMTYLKALKYDINDKFINNNHTTGDLDAFVGIRSRIDNYSTYGVNSDMLINAGGVDLTQAAMTAATARNFLEYIDTMLSYMGDEDGNNVVLYMNDILKRRFKSAIMILGAGAGYSVNQDNFGRKVEYYRNAKIVDIGRKADQTTRIITATETSAGVDGASTYTSIYGVKYGEDSFCGWQMYPFNALDMGLISGLAKYRVLIDWTFGVTMQYTRAISRIYGIKVS